LPWLSLLSDRWWEVMDSRQGVPLNPAKLRAEHTLVVLVISKNSYIQGDKVKPEIQGFWGWFIWM
jgi:hypothetical protein